jgi:hypothetical protein
MVPRMKASVTPWLRILDRVLIAVRVILAVIFGVSMPNVPQLPEESKRKRKRRKPGKLRPGKSKPRPLAGRSKPKRAYARRSTKRSV